MSEMVTIAQYAALYGVATRTVERYLKEGILPGATRVDRGPRRGWLIPADLHPPKLDPQPAPQQRATPGHDVVPAAAVAPALLPGNLTAFPVLPNGASLAGLLDSLPAYIPLEAAVVLMGISEAAIRRNRDRYGLEPVGDQGRLMVPQRTVRQVAGLDL